MIGVLQGLTEFLPVSSSGHLVIFQRFIGLGEGMLVFDIFVHFGTLLAVLVVFRKSIVKLLAGCVSDLRACLEGGESPVECVRRSENLGYAAAIVVGTVPAVLVGFTFKDSIEALFSTVLPVLASLSVTGVMLLATFLAKESDGRVGPVKGLVIGVAQALAIVPGISRSGATITAALFLKVRRGEAGEFSFLLSIPAIAGATVLALVDCMETGIDRGEFAVFAAGMFSAFVTGWVSLVVLMRIVRRGKIGYFGFYCLAVALSGIILFGGGTPSAGSKAATEKEVKLIPEVVSISSSYDGTLQKIKYIEAPGGPRPLLVALHTWSYDYTQDDVSSEYFRRCAERGWHCIFPDFRGANDKPEACGSEAALNDIIDAVKWAQERFDVDPRRIFLVGASGGGHMALHAAGRFPSTWTAVSAWVPIVDIARWHRETLERGLRYAEDIERCCGGFPGSSTGVDEEYRKRSPITSLWRAHIVPVDINAGIHDGHGGKFGGEGSVPVGHAVRAYNELVKAAGKPKETVPEDAIGYIEREERIPEGLGTETTGDPSYGRPIHLRRTCGLSRLTLFEGGHEILYDAAFAWFERF